MQMIILINWEWANPGGCSHRQAPTLLLPVPFDTLPGFHGEDLGKVFWFLWQGDRSIIIVKFIQNLLWKNGLNSRIFFKALFQLEKWYPFPCDSSSLPSSSRGEKYHSQQRSRFNKINWEYSEVIRGVEKKKVTGDTDP